MRHRPSLPLLLSAEPSLLRSAVSLLLSCPLWQLLALHSVTEELSARLRRIDEVKDDVDETNNKLKLAQDKVEKLLSSQSESRLLCLVCMLIGVFITLCLFVFYF
eukprot:COSAG04_NODE_694_length_11068_cov_5.641718_7_plen_105_part_00